MTKKILKAFMFVSIICCLAVSFINFFSINASASLNKGYGVWVELPDGSIECGGNGDDCKK